ncbi:6-phosphogluconolactonase [Solirubrobacter sp. CPCC 204708]|uniref:6-phosphogluconolactonase n=1 Tax=Solirubrobacter deserti TaxID=2282478 RepID=A0ABT4RIU9_9ACTN|nr:6-phosphogluconolactonase [Solirubrobacter deserti]MBE2320853.1 6-phosphogluconolactonase [Solirubrobacter deserti]MDA0138487.1 6-phosphogluconolactonase [Solirubrobacter deserti]
MEFRVEENPAEVVAALLAEAASAGGDVVLTGGSTPKLAYEIASRAGADWSNATVWFSDERCVPPESGLSNFRMANEALLGRLDRGVRPTVMRMEGELGPDAGSASYEASVRERMGADPRWDLLLLGLGPDAHCASLFPGKPEVEERSRLVTGVELAGMEPQVPRISLTLPALNSARMTVFLVTGADKAQAVARAFGKTPDFSSPAASVRPSAGELLVVLDPAAAKELE